MKKPICPNGHTQGFNCIGDAIMDCVICGAKPVFVESQSEHLSQLTAFLHHIIAVRKAATEGRWVGFDNSGTEMQSYSQPSGVIADLKTDRLKIVCGCFGDIGGKAVASANAAFIALASGVTTPLAEALLLVISDYRDSYQTAKDEGDDDSERAFARRLRALAGLFPAEVLAAHGFTGETNEH